jgi:hypothetical protein
MAAAPRSLRYAAHLAVYAVGYVTFTYSAVPETAAARYGAGVTTVGLLMSAALVSFVVAQVVADRLVSRTTTTRVLLGWYASNLNPNMGFNLLLPVFAAVIVGGIDSPYGAALGGLLIGLSMDVGVYLLPAEFATYRTAIAFVILVAVLLVTPEGLWGDA